MLTGNDKDDMAECQRLLRHEMRVWNVALRAEQWAIAERARCAVRRYLTLICGLSPEVISHA